MPDFNYSGNPKSSRMDQVRFEIQDTGPKAWLLTDGEVLFCIAEEAPNQPPSQAELLGAAARALEALSRRFAAQADTKIGSLFTTYSKQAEGFSARAKELRVRAAGSHAPWTGGLSESEKVARLENPDTVSPAFTRQQFSNPWRGEPGGPGPIRSGEGHPI